jgi:uncharacterized membrane protein SpoIIM required for sporulation
VGVRLSLDEAERFHSLYLRASSGLARLGGLSAGEATRQRLEGLLARAHAVSSAGRRSTPFQPLRWALHDLPRAVQRRRNAFFLTVGLTVLGAFVGAALLALEPRTRPWLLIYGHAEQTPSERVAREESHAPGVTGHEASFAAELMTHNIQVSLYAFALGLSLGIGTLALVWINGVTLGAICWDYIADGQGRFLAAWLLPHGSVEIPAILLGATAGLLLGRALLDREDGGSVRARVERSLPDILRLLWGVVVLLVWAGILESYFSQVHEPRLPYELKWGFGALQLAALTLFLLWPRREAEP